MEQVFEQLQVFEGLQLFVVVSKVGLKVVAIFFAVFQLPESMELQRYCLHLLGWLAKWTKL